jgi:hypothetical protein
MAKGISIRLYNGNIPQINLNNLICLWWDQTDVYDFDTPIGRTNSATTDADGDLVLDLTEVSGLSTGGWGYLLVRREDVIDHRDSLVFQGRVQVDDYSNGTKLYYQTIENTWKRNPDWQTYTEPSTEKFVGLHAVFESGSNFLALSAEGNYTVDWGDGGSTENFNSGVVAYHTYDYTAFDSGKATQGSVSFVATDNTVYKVNHGRLDGETVSFASITTTTGITVGQIYYVINATTNTYQLSATENGSAIDLVNDGSGYTLKYKTVVVQVYPQGGANLTKLDLHQKHNQSLLQAYSSGWLDISVYAPNCTDLRIGAQTPGSITQTITHGILEQVNIISSDLRQLEYLFYTCYELQSIKEFVTSSTAAASMSCTFTDSGDLVTASNHGFRNGDTVTFTAINSTTGITVYTNYFAINKTTDTFQVATVYGGTAVALTTNGTGTVVRGTNFSYMFSSCTSLQFIPLLNTAAGTNFSSMFYSCTSLQFIPLLNTAAGTSFSSMFTFCYRLQSIPLLNTAAGTNFNSMFYYCYSLQSIPLLNTAAGTNFSYMFSNCTSLQSIPLLNTAAGTNFIYMFSSCTSLQSIPLLNTAAGTSFSSMFQYCYALQSIPLLNTAAGTNFSYMFQYCYALQFIPLSNTAAGTSFSSMFSACYSLESIPLLNTAAGTNFSSMFNTCSSLSKGAISGTKVSISYSGCKLPPTALNEIFSYLASNVTTKTITVTDNWGAAKVSLSGTTTSGSTTVTMASTTGLSANMWITGTNISSSRSVTFQDTGDTVTLNNHGIPNGTRVSFTAITTTTGLTLKTIYYVVNTQTNTFQVSDTVGGAAKTLTTDGSGTLIYENYIVSIVPNTSITISIPASGSAANTLTSTTMNPYLATLKGWTVTN